MKLRDIFRRVDIQDSLICVGLVLCSSFVVFSLTYEVTHQRTIEGLKNRTDAIYESTTEMVNEDLFGGINNKEDMNTELYKNHQEKLLSIRKATNVRYLYTAKNDKGQYVYEIDGLEKDSLDFRVPGELIEEEILDDIECVYQGNKILPDDILDTSWGKIYLAYYPIYNQDTQQVIDVIGIEINAEHHYNTYHDLMKIMPLITIGVCVLAFLVFLF